jgi:hypothetical protein
VLASRALLAQERAVPAYEARGRTVEAHRAAMQASLQQLRARLVDTLMVIAPDLADRVDPAPPSVPRGYQLVPKLVPDAPQPADTGRRAALYSWPWTDTLIARATRRMDSLDVTLARSITRRAEAERLVADFNGIAADRRLIDAHIEHNWFWQRAIAADSARFLGASRSIDSALRGFGRGGVAPPAIPRVRMILDDSAPGPATIHVPVFTDIEDTAFVRAAQSTIERLWSGRAGGREYRVHLLVQFLSPRRLYCAAAAVTCSPPARGTMIDLTSHLARFPADTAVITTGGTQPYVLDGRSLILGPRDLSARTLGHEFGHILGFDDAYLRGYRSLGEDGYAIIEFIPDRADIMASSGFGETQPRHFAQLVANLKADRAMRAGLAAMYERRDPKTAAVFFREALSNRADHYGATFQLAKALDQSGDSSSALPVWRRMLDLAHAQGDSATAAIAQRRVGIP